MSLKFAYSLCESNNKLSYDQINFLEKRGIVRTFNSIEWYAEQIGYYKKVENVNDVLYILDNIADNYGIDYGNLSWDKPAKPTEAGLLKDLLLFGISVAFDVICDTTYNKHISSYDYLYMKTDDVRFYYNRLHQNLRRILGSRGETQGSKRLKESSKNRLAVRIAADILRVAGASSDMSVNKVLSLDWYDLVLEINNVIKTELDNFEIANVKAYLMTKAAVKRAKKTQPDDYKVWRAHVQEESDRIRAEIEEHRERCRAIERQRDLNMERYDKMCDKFGCALPMSVVL